MEEKVTLTIPGLPDPVTHWATLRDGKQYVVAIVYEEGHPCAGDWETDEGAWYNSQEAAQRDCDERTAVDADMKRYVVATLS